MEDSRDERAKLRDRILATMLRVDTDHIGGVPPIAKLRVYEQMAVELAKQVELLLVVPAKPPMGHGGDGEYLKPSVMDKVVRYMGKPRSVETMVDMHASEPRSKAVRATDEDLETERQRMSPWVPMDNKLDLAVLGKLGEETGELVKILFRTIIQGLQERDPETGKINIHEVQNEIADVKAAGDTAIQHFGMNVPAIERRIERKQAGYWTWHGMLRAMGFK